MNYLRLIDNNIVYPYTINQLYIDCPNVSFPSILNDRVLSEFGVYSVTETAIPSYDRSTQIVVERTPVNTNNTWNQVWEVVELTAQQQTDMRTEEEEQVRAQRDRLLAQTDWYIIKSIETSTPVPSNILAYRQSLRDITTQSGFPFNVIWPTL